MRRSWKAPALYAKPIDVIDVRAGLNHRARLYGLWRRDLARQVLQTSQFVKYNEQVHIVTRKHLHDAAKQYPDAAKEIGAWAAIVKEVRWHNFREVRNTFKDADNVEGYVIFNIRQNRFRLITVIHYAKTDRAKRTQGHVYIRSFLTHKEYDNPANWDRRFGTK